jgi:inner membrane protein
MDNLTHSAIGLFLSRAGLNRLTPRATPILLLAANAPDVDAVSAAGGSLNYLHFHRHLTHSLIAMPVLALIAVAIVRLASRKPVPWKGAFFAALIGVASHLVLDWTNVYGIRMLLPFSAEWLRLDTTNVIDIWIWSVAALCIAGPFLARLVGSEITSGGVKARHHGRGFARFALLFVLLYNSTRGVLHARAVASLSSRMYEDAPPVRVIAMPDSANPLRWRGLVETAGAFVVQDLNLVAPDPAGSRPTIFPKADPDPAIDTAKRAYPVSQFLRFAQFPLWRVTPWPAVEGGRLVEVFDMRFGTPLAPGFMARAVVNGSNQVVESEFHFGVPRAR